MNKAQKDHLAAKLDALANEARLGNITSLAFAVKKINGEGSYITADGSPKDLAAMILDLELDDSSCLTPGQCGITASECQNCL